MQFHSLADGRALPIEADDRLRQFLDYWTSRGTAGRLPRRRDLDPLAIVRLLPAIVLLDVETDDFRFSLVGEDIADRYGAIKGRGLRDLMTGAQLYETLDEHRLCVTARAPVYSYQTENTVGGESWQLYQRLLTPLAGDHDDVTTIAGIMVFRSYRS